MRRWHDVDHMDFAAFVSPDGLHLNDWSYACLAKGLGQAIAEAAQRPVLSASVHASRRRLSGVQRRQQILDQSSGCSSPAENRTSPSPMPSCGALRGRQPLVRRRRRMRDQALGVAEIVGDADELERVEEAEGAVFAALHLERAQRRARLHLLGDHGGLRMVGPARIDQPADLLVPGERIGDRAGGLGLPLHAHR